LVSCPLWPGSSLRYVHISCWASSRADITVFNDHLADPDALVARLLPFHVICVMRERTPLPRTVIERLPQLKLILSTGPRNASIDMAAAEERGIRVTGTGYRSTPTIEMTWALILASARHIVRESNSVRNGGWQTSVGRELDGRVLGVLGLGNIGGQVARIGLAFGMKLIAWSQNLTPEIAAAAGATLVTKDELFRQADVVSIHLILSRRTRGLVGATDLRPHRRRERAHPGPVVTGDRRRRARRLRRGALAGGSSLPDLGQCAGHAAPRVCRRGSLSDVLRRRGDKHRRMAR
jgi:phosphoglycerate dehydrogenase-like enzyme